MCAMMSDQLSGQDIQQQGIVHGHIHNYNNLTYIHGHVHNGAKEEGDSSTVPMGSVYTPQKGVDCSKFHDCQHFGFVNYHNLNLFQETNGGGVNGGEGLLDGVQDDSLLGQVRARRGGKVGSCVQCNPKIMEVCCEQPHAGQVLPGDVVLFEEKEMEQMPENNQAVAILNLQKFINCDLTCHSNGVTTSTMEAQDRSLPSPMTTADSLPSSGGSGDHVFERLCQQCMNYEPCEDAGNHQMMTACHEHIFHSETDMKILNDLASISNMYETPLSKHSGESINLLHSSISGFQDFNTIAPTPSVAAATTTVQSQSHPNHHHHRIELHPHTSLAYNNRFNRRERAPGDVSSHLRSNNNAKNVDGSGKSNTNTVNFNWSFKNNCNMLKCLWNECAEEFPTLLELQSHVLKSHISGDTSITDYPCQWKDCEFLSTDTDSLINHINGTHGISFDVKFLSDEIKEPQVQNCRHHCESRCTNAIKEKQGGIFQCTWESCHQTCKSRQELNEHIEAIHVPTGQSSYQCRWDGCTKHFAQRQKLLRHIKVHTGYKPFKCPHCSKTFSTEDILSQHIRTHSGERPFKCQFCDKRFTTSSSLRIHIRTHTGEKPLACNVCGKRFNESSNLSKHMKIHERKYMCKHCKRSFDRLQQYNIHIAKCSTTNEIANMSTCI
ncbi:Zap1p Ecym_6295 [Eremothecium cymbalariae DBVPG|uniref:C2H2-type domain-containing protein n=1 Tax=Eremothecium cymbalariae (strain CBS 270.75 / DBVPG 7215 / KCTC 17166 / NRRL Y-17582) TaxID=931890 RepID=G8JU95_ERECY|nr:hypothetical protein Ecym_6295 [Eremothecium cymbalariae DBVPG\